MKRTSDEDKRAKGTDQPSRMRGDSVKWELLTEIPQCPEHFGSDMRECWMDLCGQMLKAGILAVPYLRLIEGYCTSYATWSASTRGIKQEGLCHVRTYADGFKKIVANPLTKVQASAMATMLSYAAKLGCTPRDIDSISGGAPEEDKNSLLK